MPRNFGGDARVTSAIYFGVNYRALPRVRRRDPREQDEPAANWLVRLHVQPND